MLTQGNWQKKFLFMLWQRKIILSALKTKRLRVHEKKNANVGNLNDLKHCYIAKCVINY